MVIDSHQHFWNYHPERHTWIDETMAVLRKDYLPADLEPLLIANNVDGCVAVQADMSEAETRFLLQLASDHQFIKGVVGWVDLLDKNADARLEHFSANPLLKGIRHIVQDEPDDNFMLNPQFQRGISKLATYSLTYDILVYPRQLPAAIALVRQFPGQHFVVDHLAKPRVSEGVDPKWKSNMESLAACPNVVCKISGMVTEAAGFSWNKETFYPFMDILLEAFGSRRLLFGSDWPVCLLAADYGRVKDIVSSFLDPFPALEKRDILGENAIKVYNL